MFIPKMHDTASHMLAAQMTDACMMHCMQRVSTLLLVVFKFFWKKIVFRPFVFY